MRDSYRIALSLVLFMVIMAIDVVLLIRNIVDTLWFYVIMALGLAVMFLTMLTIKGEWVKLTDSTIELTGPMANLSIPFSSITSVECIRDFKAGIRTYGYGGAYRGSGDFMNDTLGSYKFAGDTRIPVMIVVRFNDKKARIAAFNLRDEETTLSIYDTIVDSTSVGTVPMSSPESCEKTKRSYRSTRNTMYAITGILVVIVAVIVAFAMTTGHVNVSMDEDSVNIDASMMRADIPYTDITDVELREDMKYGTRVGGLGNSNFLTGNFMNDEFGTYKLAVFKSCNLCIVIHTADKVYAFNQSSTDDTLSFYDELLGKIPLSTISSDWPTHANVT